MTRVRWKKASYTNLNGACIELSHTLTHMRDTKNRTGPTLRGDMAALVAAVEADQVGR